MTRFVPGPCSATPCFPLPCPVSAPVFYFKDSGDSPCPRALLSNSLLSSALSCQCMHMHTGPSLLAVCSAAVVNVMCIHHILRTSCSMLTFLSTDVPYLCMCSQCFDSTPAVCAVRMQLLIPRADVAEANQCNYQGPIPAKLFALLPNSSAS